MAARKQSCSAAALERYGYDSSAVLRVADLAGRSGGGPAFVAPTWEETKIGLQRAAIWLRCQLAPGDIGPQVHGVERLKRLGKARPRRETAAFTRRSVWSL